MKKKPDIIVVGGGPSGSYAAYVAAKLGASVLVCEEHETIGEPSHCAGHLNISSLNNMGIVPPEDAIENRIKGAFFFSPIGKKFELRCNNPVTYVVNRTQFDRYIAELAKDAGVNYQFKSKVRSLILDSGIIKGVKINRNSERVESNLVIDAEGCSSAILKKTALKGLKSSMVVRGIEAELINVEDLDKEMVEVYFGKRFAPYFFAWIIPKKDGQAKIGLATRIGDPRVYLQNFIENHPIASKKLKNAKITHKSLHPIPLEGPLTKTYSDGLIVVGDAASQVKPTTGGGVIFGLTCAKIAGEVAYESVNRQDYSESFLASYQSKWKQLVGFDLLTMLRMRRMLDSLSDKKIDKVIELSNKFGISKVLEKFGDIDFQGRSLISMVKHPGILAVVGYFLFSWFISSERK
ncbi:MAG: NAD(P)/FAD-dependent oxidoreductase [Candidatus Bathyarchaeota archaeon]